MGWLKNLLSLDESDAEEEDVIPTNVHVAKYKILIRPSTTVGGRPNGLFDAKIEREMYGSTGNDIIFFYGVVTLRDYQTQEEAHAKALEWIEADKAAGNNILIKPVKSVEYIVK